MLQKGSQAPQFQSIDQEGKSHSITDYAGKWLLLYFYPEDDTSGCTKEACMIRDSFQDFRDKGISVLGVSSDNQESHANFAQKYSLPFSLLVDSDKTILRAYQALADNGDTLRTSYLINPEGVIAKVYIDVQPEIHAEEILRDFEAIQ